MLAYREIRPHPPLSRFVDCFWTLAGPAPAAAVAEPILPDGCMELVLNCGAPFRRRLSSGVFERQPLHMLVGQMETFVEIQPGGHVDLLGVRFRPAGARGFLRTSMSELAGRLIALEDLDLNLSRAIAAALDGPAASRVARIEAALAGRLVFGACDDAIGAAVGQLLHASGNVSVETLAATAQLSPRQLERRFREAVGLGPKRLARILRFQRVFRAVSHASGAEASATPDWAVVAVDCGYYDQAHLIRDFREFAGQTPSLLLAADALLTHHFTGTRRPA